MAKAKDQSKKFVYKSSVAWQENKKGILTSLGKPNIPVAPPPEFKGYVGVWTPEDLLVASANSCYLLTFLFYINKENIELITYECEAEGILKLVDKRLAIAEVKLMPRISVRLSNENAEKLNSLLGLSKQHCFIFNSIKAKVEIFPEIKYLS